MKKFTLLLCMFCCILVTACNKNNLLIKSPDSNLKVQINHDSEGALSYSVFYQDNQIMKSSKLGIIREDDDFSKNLNLDSVSDIEKVTDEYFLHHGKKQNCVYKANKKVFFFSSKKKNTMQIVFQLSNDGLAFKYVFPENDSVVKKIKQELSSFHFDTSTIAFIQPCPDSKTGWSQTQPSYEEYYNQGNKVGLSAPYNAGWVFPALFNFKEYWMLVSETGLEKNYCASRLSKESPDGEYSIAFPQASEGVFNGPVLPESRLPWATPWRIITIGKGLAPIVESTLGTDLSIPEKYSAANYYKAGKASWSWVLLKDESVVFDVQKKFIDYAANMNWKYCLVDALWDKTIGYKKIKELAEYAKTKNVGILLWYNSAGDWNTTYQTPKDKMLTHVSRIQEFQKLKEMGIAGIKVDFFAGDGQSSVAYYQEILEDAAKYNILVNFHGCTLPRGWQRTYPNLVSMESVRGYEYITFEQANADLAANHSAMLPFTRNVFDPMDFTPVCLNEIPNINKKTTTAFDLALSVLFLSGIQHMAETPEGMEKQPEYIKDFLKTLPDTWDDIKFLSGYPGKNIVLARKNDTKWYVAGINGQDISESFNIDLSFIEDGEKTISIIKDMEQNKTTLEILKISNKDKINIACLPQGGFSAVIE